MLSPEGNYVAVLDTTKMPVADLYQNHLILQGSSKTEQEMQNDVEKAYNPFIQALADEIEYVTRMEPVVITGQDAVDNAQRHGVAMETRPLVVLGQSFYHNVLTRTGELWNAYDVHVSRLYLPNVSKEPVGYIPQINHPSIEQQTHTIASSLQQERHGSILLADDNASRNANTFGSTAQRFQNYGVETEAYIAGFYAGAECDKNGDRTRINGIPMYAVRSRYSTPEDIQRAKNNEIKVPPSIETIDMLYLPNSGVALSEGFPEANNTIAELRACLQSYTSQIQNGKRLYAETVVCDIEQLGVEVGNEKGLLTYLENNKNTQISIPQLIDLLGEPEGERPILHVPQFHILKPDSRRIPHIWPGEKENQSFWNHLDEKTWMVFSNRMQTVTINLLSSLENASGYEIPSSLFPFLSLPDIKKYFKNNVPERAIDAIHMLSGPLMRNIYKL